MSGNNTAVCAPHWFSSWIRPRCWPCHLFLTSVCTVFAVSGAADISSVIVMIGTGVVLDIARFWLCRCMFMQAYWIREIARALSDPKYVTKERNLFRWRLVSTTAIFLLHGLLWALLVPSESHASASLFMHLYPEPHAFLRISNIARCYLGELDGRGYPGRGRLWEDFVFQSFIIYITCVILWAFLWSKSTATLNLIIRYQAISARTPNLKPFSFPLLLLALFSIAGFFIVNNLVTAHGVNQDVRAALPTSNSFFMTYSIQMLFSCLLAVWTPSLSIPYCLDLEALISPIQEEKTDD
jgi:hypothetical protein